MRAFIREHLTIAVTAILATATLVGAVGWWWPGSRSWMSSHPDVGWGLALAGFIVVAVVWMVGDRGAAALEREVSIRDQTIEELRKELGDLNRQVQRPSERDRRQVAEIERRLSWDEMPLSWLRWDFAGDRWTGTQSDPLYHLNDRCREWYFDDPAVNAAFERFRAALDRFLQWMAGEGALDRVSEDEDGRAGECYYSIGRPGDYASYEAFKAVREGGLQLRTEFLDQRREFERIARAHGH